jgi:phosphoribosylformylglycinamidine synthase
MSQLTSILMLRGSTALSPFRLEKLLQPLQEKYPAVRSIHAEFVHFVQVCEALNKDEMAILEALITYGSPAINAPIGTAVRIEKRETHRARHRVLC